MSIGPVPGPGIGRFFNEKPPRLGGFLM